MVAKLMMDPLLGLTIVEEQAVRALKMVKYMVATGDPGDGFTYVGPFRDGNEARTWAERVWNRDWWILELHEPEDQEHNTKA